MKNLMAGSPYGPGDIRVDSRIPDGTYGSFVLVTRIEIKDGKVVSVLPDGIDYTFTFTERPGTFIVGSCARSIEDREKYPSWPSPEPEELAKQKVLDSLFDERRKDIEPIVESWVKRWISACKEVGLDPNPSRSLRPLEQMLYDRLIPPAELNFGSKPKSDD